MYKKSLSTTPDINPYTFCGYCTVYNYHPIAPSVTPPVTRKRNDAFPPATPEGGEYSVPIRARISQFLILPPYQKHSLGSKLYSVVYKNLLKSPGVFEITVEDPSDEFDQLRDFCDLSYLRSSVPEFLHLRLNANTKVERKGRVPVGNIVDTKSLEKIRRRTKLAPRQFERCVEMQLLSTISPIVRAKLTVGLNYQASSKPSDSEKRELHLYRLWTLIVKQRLFKHNRDGLAQFDRTERIDKLEDTVRSVELDYADKLEKWERKKRADKERAAGRSVSVVSSTPAAEEVKKEAKTGAETEEKADSVVKEEKEAKPESNTSKKRSAPVSPEQESKKARMESVTDDGN